MGGCGRWKFTCLAASADCSVDLEHPALLDYLSSLPCPSARTQLAMPPTKKAKLDFLAQVSKKFVGSGDPEISDAQDVLTYLSEK